MKGVKAFDKGLICRDYQFEENKEHTTDEKIVPCESGFHFCKEEQALSVLNYYPPNSEFHAVEATGKTVEYEDKVVTNKLTVQGKLNLSALFKLQFNFIRETCEKSSEANTSGDEAHANTSGDEAHANTSGDEAHANTSGYEAHANTSGDEAHANTSGNYAHANTSGNYAHANTSGYEAIASALGVQSKAKAINGWIIIVDWRYNNGWKIENIHSSKVGGKIQETVIEADTWYWFQDGTLKSNSTK